MSRSRNRRVKRKNKSKNRADKRANRRNSSNSNQSQRKTLKPKGENQYQYVRSMSECDLVLCSGPAGSGKTACCVGYACGLLLSHKINKIVVARPAIESGRGLGHLPGTFNDKVQPYMVPVLEEMKKYLSVETYHMMRSTGVIEVCPLEFMRGRTFDDAFTILDEAQNATFEQIVMFITRLGKNSTGVINGDPDQTDLKGRDAGAFDQMMDDLSDLEGVDICELEACDIVRNPIIAKVLDRVGNRR